MQENADKDNDGRVNLEDWLALGTPSVGDVSEGLVGFIQKQVDFFFHALDLNSDGVLTTKEYEALGKIWAIDPKQYAQVIEKIDINGNGLLSRDNLRRLLCEYYLSTNPEDPGNWIFGPF